MSNLRGQENGQKQAGNSTSYILTYRAGACQKIAVALHTVTDDPEGGRQGWMGKKKQVGMTPHL
jgi:hypothetical protein